ncbi:MAG: hypothetical protein OXC08_16135 [Thiotrichales bacterium]|nr:hypothetical protein [Thiotrichales bacterium]
MEPSRYFIEPLDVLFLRGNKLFGDPGSFGESLVPPWPSVVAGAVRSALLAARGYDFAAFARGEIAGDAELGTPDVPGTFTVTAFDVACRHAGGGVETLHRVPADLGIRADVAERGGVTARRIVPQPLFDGIGSSARTASLAVLGERERGKQVSGQWLSSEGWRTHLAGLDIDPQRHLVPSTSLWALDTRTGIALDAVKRAATTGALFTSQAVAMRKREHAVAEQDGRDCAQSFDVGFLVEIAGATLPDAITLRFGGDGRAALAVRQTAGDAPRHSDYDAIVRDGRCRMILTTPGLFEGGWRPTGSAAGNGALPFELHGVSGRIVCAAVPRAEVVSGFDLARRCPKPAERVAPYGSVYWLDEIEASADALRKLADRGLWSNPAENEQRRAEGFNRFTFAEWRD